jgi:hypothetical protein
MSDCPTGKQQVASRKEAKAISRRLPMVARIKATAYYCRECGFWHVGHPFISRREKKTRNR